MTDSWVVNVRQLTEYPFKPVADTGDAVLLQTGGLGGPYNFTTSIGVTQALQAPGQQLGVGVPLPGDAVGTGVISTHLLTLTGCSIGWNWYVNSSSVPARLAPGAAGMLCFDAGGNLTVQTAPAGAQGAPLGALSAALSLTAAGYLTLPQTALVGRD